MAATPAIVITLITSQPIQVVNELFTLLPIILWLELISTMSTRTTGATTPLATADQIRALIGSMPRKFIPSPINIEIIITS